MFLEKKEEYLKILFKNTLAKKEIEVKVLIRKMRKIVIKRKKEKIARMMKIKMKEEIISLMKLLGKCGKIKN